MSVDDEMNVVEASLHILRNYIQLRKEFEGAKPAVVTITIGADHPKVRLPSTEAALEVMRQLRHYTEADVTMIVSADGYGFIFTPLP